MSALLAYRNSTPEVMAWVADFTKRTQAVAEARYQWMKELYDTAGVREDDGDDVQSWKRFRREARAYDNGTLVGLTWPEDEDHKLPEGWFRPVKTPHLVRPRGGAKYKHLHRELAKYNRPDRRGELQERFGMQAGSFAGTGLYRPGVAFEDDGVWVTWGSTKIADEKWAADLGQHGWVRVPLVEYIERFGEDAL